MSTRYLLFALPALLAAGERLQATDLKDTIGRAQYWIAQRQFTAAIDLLQRALPEAEAEHADELLASLRHAYRSQIQQLVQAGRRNEARKYLDRLRLIEATQLDVSLESKLDSQAPIPSSQAHAVERNPGFSETPGIWKIAKPPATKPVGSPRVPDEVTVASATVSNPAARHQRVKLLGIVPLTESNGPVAGADNNVEKWLWQADVLFQARRYQEAGTLYSRVHQADPRAVEPATDRWAYCRMVRLAAQINRRSRTPDDWKSIQQEAQAIVSLIPKNRYARGLLELARNQGKVAGGDEAAGPRVVRANTPDTPDYSRLGLLSGLASRIGRGLGAEGPGRSLWRRFRSRGWQVLETSNFRIHYTDEQFAGPVADVAERARIELYRTWFGTEPTTNWQPKCDIFVHRSAAAYARATGQGPASPGHSATLPEAGRIVSRRVDLRQDAPDLIRAVLPHEITHVVMADRFVNRQLPRWADEGIAILSEPEEKKRAHLSNLAGFLQSGRRFTAGELMRMGDYPPGQLWPLFYSQSVSLVEFMIEQKGPAAFIDFMSRAVRDGYESQLEQVYGFASFRELDQAWAQATLERI